MDQIIRKPNPRESGIAMVLALVLMVGLLGFTAVSIDLTKTHVTVQRSERELLSVRSITESAMAQALARLKEGGVNEPVSGNGVNPAWVPFSGGEFYYSSAVDLLNETVILTAWGRLPVGPMPSGSPLSPADVGWDGTDYLAQGIELTVRSSRYIPNSPAYFGNGGIQKPLGGFSWGAGVDPFDPSTWQSVTSNPSSYQDASVPLQVNALSHPFDYLYNGGGPDAASAGMYSPWISQTLVGQANTEAWFNQSAGGGSALSGVTPDPSTYSMNPSDPNYAFPIETAAPDVQDFAWGLWNRFENKPGVNMLNQGSHFGTYGDLNNPTVTFVTGQLIVPANKTFEGSGVLVIRDDFDPNIDTDNTPGKAAKLLINGTLNWTGLVIIAGWNAQITVNNSGDMTVVGSLMGEDSVMSGGEISLDSASIILKVRNDMRLLYSADMFKPGGYIYDLLPSLRKEVLGARDLFPGTGTGSAPIIVN